MSDNFPIIPVRGTIRLGQFLKLAGLVEDGVHARELIQDEDVLVNGQVDTRRGRQLAAGDTVSVVLASGTVGATVG